MHNMDNIMDCSSQALGAKLLDVFFQSEFPTVFDTFGESLGPSQQEKVKSAEIFDTTPTAPALAARALPGKRETSSGGHLTQKHTAMIDSL